MEMMFQQVFWRCYLISPAVHKTGDSVFNGVWSFYVLLLENISENLLGLTNSTIWRK